MQKDLYINPSLKNLLKEKASHSPCTYKISAIALDHKGDILGHETNTHSINWNVLDKCGEGRAGTGTHAERKLISTFKKRIKTIIICRIGNSGEILPISPCKVCQKVANKYGIKIISVKEGYKK